MRWLVGNVGIAVARAMIRLPPIIALPLLRESIENVKRFAIVSSIKFTVSRKNQWKSDGIGRIWEWNFALDGSETFSAINYGSRGRGNRNSSTLVSSPFNATSVS